MHTEIYTIKGRKYKYQVTNYRVGNKVKHTKNISDQLNPQMKLPTAASCGVLNPSRNKDITFANKSVLAKSSRERLQHNTTVFF